MLSISCRTSATLMPGCAATNSAASADAYGVAIDVPLPDAYACVDALYVESTSTPGATTST